MWFECGLPSWTCGQKWDHDANGKSLGKAAWELDKERSICVINQQASLISVSGGRCWYTMPLNVRHQQNVFVWNGVQGVCTAGYFVDRDGMRERDGFMICTYKNASFSSNPDDCTYSSVVRTVVVLWHFGLWHFGFMVQREQATKRNWHLILPYVIKIYELWFGTEPFSY